MSRTRSVFRCAPKSWSPPKWLAPSTPESSRRGCRARWLGSCAMRPDALIERHDLAAAVHATLVAHHRDARADDPDTIAALVRAHDPLASASAVADVVDRVLARTVGFGPLDVL